MKTDDFNKQVSKRLGLITSILLKKGDEYASTIDRLHSFKEGCNLSFHNIPEKFGWELNCKHLQSIKDMLNKIELGQLPSEDLVEEKFGDAINYLILLEAMIKERINYKYGTKP